MNRVLPCLNMRREAEFTEDVTWGEVRVSGLVSYLLGYLPQGRATGALYISKHMVHSIILGSPGGCMRMKVGEQECDETR